ncbi:MAG: DUF1854 domain-containing protein [Phycisphaerae bacterium]|nr:DUF1854 domain-containing protein [Phycisphaerae bacterium]
MADASPPTPSSPPTGRVEEITRNAAGQIEVRLQGAEAPVVDVCVARSFPWSLPDAYISLRTKDGKEIALLETLDELDEPSRNVLRRELADKVFNPRIVRVLAHRDEFGVTSITAETDRGLVTFQIRTRDDVRLLSRTRALFRDADGNVYEVPDIAALDSRSRRFLQEYF